MSDRGFLFLFSIFMIVAGVGSAVWLGISGQVLTVDGLFLVLTALLVALCFALYLKFMISSARAAAQQPAKAPAKPAPAAAKPTPVAQA